VLGALVLLNGVPGSGKSFLGTALARDLGLPRLGKDDIKEALWDANPPGAGPDPLEWSRRLGAVAFEVLWRLAPSLGPRLILEAPFLNFHAAPILGLHAVPIEVYLTTSPEVLHRRYQERQPGLHECHHFHPLPGLEDVVAAMAAARPMDLGGPLLRVDTTQGADPAAVADWVRSQLALDDPAPRVSPSR
jgi:predicted kinase